MRINRYPKLLILSKNELAKHISHKGFSKQDALDLINTSIQDHGKHWKDNKNLSEPDKGKYVRNAKGTPLGKLLDKLNKNVLAPNDEMVPEFIFGGLKKKNHALAAKHLLGIKRKRIAIKMDISTFFEQISGERVYYFFRNKCKCSHRASKLLADLCCVPVGPKGSESLRKTIGRGFATSSRLAFWCNIDTFIKLERFIKKRLRGKNPRIVIYVDDIGITASGVTKIEMEDIAKEVKILLERYDQNQPLPIKDSKTKITSHEEGIEHLGIRLHRNKLSVGGKARSKRDKTKAELMKTMLPKSEKRALKTKYNSQNKYKNYIEKIR